MDPNPFDKIDRRLPKLLVIGYAGHGKDTVGELLRHYGFNPKGSSEFAAERIMMPYFESIGTKYPSVEECFADRVNHRPIWFRQIEDFNEGSNWSGLTQELLLAGHDTYLGMRSRQEFEASRAFFDWVVWVDASKRLPPEDASSNALKPSDADWIIDNNQTQNGLLLQVKHFLQLIGVTV